MHRYQKYVNALFLAAAGLVWLISRHYLQVAIGYFQLGRRMGEAVEFVEHGVPFVLAVATFLVLRANVTTQNFTTDAVSELVKVTWPAPKDVRLGTIVVIVTVLLAGLALGLLDMGLNVLIRGIIGA